MQGHTDWVCTAAIIPPESDNLHRYAISGAYDCTLRLWDLESGECLRTFEGHSDPVLVVKVTPDGRYAISGSRNKAIPGSGDKTLIVWEVKTGKILHTLEGHTNWVVDLAITSDSRYVVSGSHDCTLRLWDLGTGKCLRTFEGHEDRINTLAITKDNQFVISGSGDPHSRRAPSGAIDHTLHRWDLWNRDNPQPVEIFEGHQEGINQIMITPDGNHVVSASQDHSLRLWKLNSGGQCVAKFFGDTEISCVDIVDDRLFVAGAGNGALHVLELKD